MPLVDYIDQEGILCNFVESCAPPNTVEEAYELFNSNFERHYTTNRAPFYMLLEEQWLANSTYYKGRFRVKVGHLYMKAKNGISTSSSRFSISDFRPLTSDFHSRFPTTNFRLPTAFEFPTRKSKIASYS